MQRRGISLSIRALKHARRQHIVAQGRRFATKRQQRVVAAMRSEEERQDKRSPLESSPSGILPVKEAKPDFTKISSTENFNGVHLDVLSEKSTSQEQQQQQQQEISIPIDVKTLYEPSIHLPDKPDFNDPSLCYEAATPLSEELIKLMALS